MTTTPNSARRGIPFRLIGWGGAAFVLLLPLLTNAPWTLSDYVVMGVMLGGAGLVLEAAARMSGNLLYKAGIALAVAASFLLIWVNLAVGFLGNEGNPANLMFLGVILVAILGSVFAGFRADGMARAMFAAAAAQLLVGVAGLAAGWASPGPHGIYEVTMGTALFVALWFVSGVLFHKAARQPAAAAR